MREELTQTKIEKKPKELEKKRNPYMTIRHNYIPQPPDPTTGEWADKERDHNCFQFIVPLEAIMMGTAGGCPIISIEQEVERKRQRFYEVMKKKEE